MKINEINSLYGAQSVEGRVERKAAGHNLRQNALAASDTVAISDQALALSRASAPAGEQTPQDEGIDWLAARQEDAAEAQSPLKEKGKSLVSMMLDAIFMHALEEEEQKPLAPPQGESGGEDAPASSPVTDNRAAQLNRMMDDMLQGKLDVSELPQALLNLSSGRGQGPGRVSSETGQNKRNG